MRRKIEKCLAKKQGVDEANIRYTEDGRFDFMGDLEGVLNAVRGKDALGKSKKGDRRSSKKNSKKGRKDDHKMPPMGMTMSYMPYGMHPYPGMAPHPMYAHDMSYATAGKENMMPPHMSHPYAKHMHPATTPGSSTDDKKIPLAPKPSTEKTPMSFSTKETEEDDSSTPFTSMSFTPGPSSSRRYEPTSGYMSVASSRKSIFDTPKGLGGSLEKTLGSPGALNIHGMTPLSSLKDTFATPYGASDMFSGLSPEDNLSLNKALFADEDGRRSTKTPGTLHTHVTQTPCSTKTPRQMKLYIGGTEDSMTSFISDMKYNRVSISPMSYSKTLKRDFASTQDESKPEDMDKNLTPPQSVSRSIHFADDRGNDDMDSAFKVYQFMPTVTGEAQTPRNVTLDSDSNDISAPSPFDASLTPIGPLGDQGFWGRQLGFSPSQSTLTPFKSPALPLSIKKERRALSTLSLNTMHSKPVSTLKARKDSVKIKSESPSPNKRQRTSEVVAEQ